MGTNEKARVFEDSEAKRTNVPALIGLTGPSGSGKTFSALRLATGLQRVSGGEIFYIDTEAKRALHYADRFRFRHIQFKAPFGPLDYLAAIEHCVNKGAKTIIVDSMSHEHEGPGGVLEMHDHETDRLAQQWKTSRDKVQMTAWAKPKAERRRLINSILQLGINGIFCFRAKEKLKVIPGKPPLPLGWMPIAGEEFVYEMTVNCLLYPASGGVPTWNPDEPGEKQMLKLPEQFKELFGKSRPLDEGTGEAIAKWAAGESQSPRKVNPAATLSKLAAMGVTTDRVLALVGRASADEITEDDMQTIHTRGLQVKNGADIDAAFPPVSSDAETAQEETL